MEPPVQNNKRVIYPWGTLRPPPTRLGDVRCEVLLRALPRGGGCQVIERSVGEGPPRRFPERADLVQKLIEQGLVADEDDLLQRRPDLAGDIMLNWIQHSQTGCRFATHLAKRRATSGWQIAVVPRRLREEVFRSVIEGLLRPQPTEAEMVMVVFPWVISPEDLADLIGMLARCEAWSWEEPVSMEGGSHDECLVGLRWALPSGTAESWVLGFAPFPFMPFTRRAPYTAIVMRTRDPEPDALPSEGRAPVHLAQVPHFFGDRADEIWKSTQRQRATLLGEELTHAAKARVSFVIPRNLAERCR